MVCLRFSSKCAGEAAQGFSIGVRTRLPHSAQEPSCSQGPSGRRSNSRGTKSAGKARQSDTGLTDLARIHKYHEINAYHASNGLEGPRVYDPAGPERDATPAEGLQGRRRQL